MIESKVKIQIFKNSYKPDLKIIVSNVETKNNYTFSSKESFSTIIELKEYIKMKFKTIVSKLNIEISNFKFVDFDDFVNRIKTFLKKINLSGNFYFEQKYEITFFLKKDSFFNEVKVKNYLEIKDNKHTYYRYNLTSKNIEKIFEKIVWLKKCKDIASDLKNKFRGNILFSEMAASGIVHESLGHLLEEDFWSFELYKYFKGNVNFNNLTIIDDPTIENLGGSYKFDDDGNLGECHILIEDGVFNSLIGSNSNSKFSKTGNGRCVNFTEEIISRQSNFFVQSGNYTDEELLKKVENGVYVFETGAGIFKGLEFDIEIKLGAFIKNGNCEYFTGGKLIGNSFDFIKSIKALGNETIFFDIECSHFGQWFYDITSGSPKLFTENLEIIPWRN